MVTPKERYFARVYAEADWVECACGCGTEIKNKDKYGRDKKYVSGHNNQRYSGNESSRAAATKRWAKNNPDKIRDGKRHFYRKRKLRSMEWVGNKCHFCALEYDGYNSPVFEFHHTDPSNKKYGITRMLTTYSWEKVEEELAKCVLTCANCHNQHHGGKW